MTAGKKILMTMLIIAVGAGTYFGYTRWRYHAWSLRYDRGVELYRQKEYGEAATVLRAVYDSRPNTPRARDAFFRHCLCLEAEKKKDSAGECWTVILSKPAFRKYHAPALLALSRSSLEMNDLASAEKHVHRCITAFPNYSRIADAYLLLCRIHEAKGNIEAAAETARTIVESHPGSDAVKEAHSLLGDYNIRLLFSRRITPGTQEYVVQPGDSLQGIAQKFGTTIELVREMNKEIRTGDILHPNDRLKICAMTFSILVDKSANTLTLKADERTVKIYPVGTGKEGTTPVGEFTITNKIVEPEWFKPGGGVVPYGNKENLLGTRWMGFDSPGYGIHGTWEPDTVGYQSSAGCIRMLNNDVEELFIIVPVGTKVRVIN